ncbi:Uncharacterised protein [Enterobacter cancerogenus]|uniref:Uncharacterized protein n=1 Tax=Enterobacter cancerogenus TaxID=69218 RepID=A0A484XQP0_9ENTR|nr:Uncharacterised protein [Enterobacter cancerogenus]
MLIKRVLSRCDYQASAEINEILTRLTNPGAPASGIEIQEDDFTLLDGDLCLKISMRR